MKSWKQPDPRCQVKLNQQKRIAAAEAAHKHSNNAEIIIC